MKKLNRLMLITFVYTMILSSTNSVYAGANPAPDGGHWNGPAVIADVILTNEMDGDTPTGFINADFTASYKGTDVTGAEIYEGVITDITEKDHLLYFLTPNLQGIIDPFGDSGILTVSKVISLDIDQSAHPGVVYARVIVLFNVSK